MTTVNGVGAGADYSQVQQKKKGGAGKAVASAFIPGLGQFCDGRNKAGLASLGGVVGAGIGSRLLSVSYLNGLIKDVEKSGEKAVVSGGTKAKFYGAIALGLASGALYIANIVDAYKGGKAKEAQPQDDKVFNA